jgi:hypothetical protein
VAQGGRFATLAKAQFMTEGEPAARPAAAQPAG